MTCLPKSISGEVYLRFNPRTPVEILAQNSKSIHGLAALRSTGSRCRGAASPAAQQSPQSMPQFPIPKLSGLGLASGLRPKPAHHYLPDPTKPVPWAFQFSDTLSNDSHTQNIDNTLEMDMESNFQEYGLLDPELTVWDEDHGLKVKRAWTASVSKTLHFIFDYFY